MSAVCIPYRRIETKIFVIRGLKVMLDRDLSELYGVPTGVLNQAVKRNPKRFPSDFMFKLTDREVTEVVTNCDHLSTLKFSKVTPYAFTEQGVAMLSSVLNSERAVQVNIQIMRTFTKLKEFLISHKELAQKIKELERRFHEHDHKITLIFEAIKQLLQKPKEEEKKGRIGFYLEEKERGKDCDGSKSILLRQKRRGRSGGR